MVAPAPLQQDASESSPRGTTWAAQTGTKQLLRSPRKLGFKVRVGWSLKSPSSKPGRGSPAVLLQPCLASLRVKDTFWQVPGMLGTDLWGLGIVSRIWLAVRNAISHWSNVSSA